MKVHRSAVCVVPPVSYWPAIQAIRSVNDKSYVRWMPHINLLYPFYSEDGNTFEESAARAAEVLQAVKPFQISLRDFRYFRHVHSATVWLNPEETQEEYFQVAADSTSPSSALQTLHHALLSSFPDCDDLSSDPKRKITAYTPHLSVGQWHNAAAAEEAQRELARGWEPIEFNVNSVAIMSRRGKDDPFTLRWRVPLGGAQRLPEEVNEAYAVERERFGGG